MKRALGFAAMAHFALWHVGVRRLIGGGRVPGSMCRQQATHITFQHLDRGPS